ncbi:hypothetical protein OHB54_02180 [Streptomyces sp. NBC_01007]|nr:hypothetical protein OHB54_02180 [Streptomyces sp. NBC_01007]
MRRRNFIASTTGTATAALPIVKQRRSVGMSDVSRVAANMNRLVEADDHQGGHVGLAAADAGIPGQRTDPDSSEFVQPTHVPGPHDARLHARLTVAVTEPEPGREGMSPRTRRCPDHPG